jgi:hypothetical protein
MVNYQIQYCRSRRALPLTRGYIEAREQALLGEAEEERRVQVLMGG